MSSKTDVKKLTFAEITAMPRGDRYSLYKDNVVKPFGAVTKAKEVVDSCMHNAMKLTASLKREYAAMLFAREIAPDMTEGKFFTQYAGGDMPARVKGLATFFNAACLTLVDGKPLITEDNIDAASVTSLDAAAPIIATERKNAGDAWMVTDFTKEVVSALSSPGDATKKLREIRKRQNPKADDEGGAETPTAALLALLLSRIASATDDENGYLLFNGCQELADKWGTIKAIPATRYAEWLAKREAAAKAKAEAEKPKITHGNDGAPPPADAEPAEKLEPAGAAS
jgi:hypothetical protein